jgi:anaerobic magnesium-protoporphyrin IX monomethyl ester cyclase
VIQGLDTERAIDAVFINAPLKNYDRFPRRNDFTLPVLGLGYIATYARSRGLNVGVLDAEAGGLGVSKVAAIVNAAAPRWVGLNLLAPTYRTAIEIIHGLDDQIAVMVGGHQAKAMPERIVADRRIRRLDALILGEGEYRVAELLLGRSPRCLPGMRWRDERGGVVASENTTDLPDAYWLSPDINGLPIIDRRFFINDPFDATDGRREANLVGSRGCPYNCSFCGAAVSANPDVTIRTRHPTNIISELFQLKTNFGVSAARFVDDLFLTSKPFMERCMEAFEAERVGDHFVWDATGRVNILHRLPEAYLHRLRQAGCREIALGIEAGSDRLLKYMGKNITREMIVEAVRRTTAAGIHVKGYFIFGFPTETAGELQQTIDLIRSLRTLSGGNPGYFRCSAFEFRPYPGTPEWDRLIGTGLYSEDQLLAYEHVDLGAEGIGADLLDRDEFNFSVNLQFSEVPLGVVRGHVAEIMREQKSFTGQQGSDFVRRTFGSDEPQHVVA